MKNLKNESENEQQYCVTFGLCVPNKYKNSLEKLFNMVTDFKNEYIKYIWRVINTYAEQDEEFKNSIKTIKEQNKTYGKAVNKSDLDENVQNCYNYIAQAFKDKKIPKFSQLESNFTNSADKIYNIWCGEDVKHYACQSVNMGFQVMFGLHPKVKTIGKNVRVKKYDNLGALIGRPIHSINKTTGEIDTTKIRGTLRIHIDKSNVPYLRMYDVSDDGMSNVKDYYEEYIQTDMTKRWNSPNHKYIALKICYDKNDILQRQIIESEYKGITKLTRVFKKGQWRYYVQVNFKGISPKLKSMDFKNRKVAVNINTEMVAVVRDDGSQELIELTPDTPRINEEIKELSRYMDNSKIATNSELYHKDGRIKYTKAEMKQLGLKWHYSKGYMKAKNKRQELYRLLRCKRKLNNDRLANYILKSGNEFILDRNQYRAWQMKMNRMNKQSNAKYNNGVRVANDYAKQIQNGAPGYFKAKLENTCNSLQLPFREVSGFSSSTYNHFTQSNDIFLKLNQRFASFKNSDEYVNDISYNETAVKLVDTINIIENNDKRYAVQRDLYACSKLLFVHQEVVEKVSKKGKKYKTTIDVIDNEAYSKWFEEVFYPKHIEYLQELIKKYNLGIDLNGLILGTKN